MEIRPPKSGAWFQHRVAADAHGVRIQFLHAVPYSDPMKYLMRTEYGKEFEVNAEFLGRLLPLEKGPIVRPNLSPKVVTTVSNSPEKQLIEDWLKTLSFGGLAS